MAWGQYVYGNISETKHPEGRLKVVHGMNGIGIYGDCFSAMFSAIQGGLISYVYGGTELVEKMPRPNFWRAMTDNDLANLLPFRAGQWKIASMYLSNRYVTGKEEVFYETYAIKEDRENERVEVTFKYHLPTKPAKDCLLTYTVHSDGTIDMRLKMDKSSEVGELPEFGLLFTFDRALSNLKWYGLGPEETYADRDHAKLSVYRCRVKDNMAKYLVPQECGNKRGVRFAELTDDSGLGLRFEGENLNFSALPFSPHEIDNALHDFELPEINYTYVRLALAQMGVGGDDTWGARTKPEHMIDNSKRLELDFSFRGIC